MIDISTVKRGMISGYRNLKVLKSAPSFKEGEVFDGQIQRFSGKIYKDLSDKVGKVDERVAVMSTSGKDTKYHVFQNEQDASDHFQETRKAKQK